MVKHNSLINECICRLLVYSRPTILYKCILFILTVRIQFDQEQFVFITQQSAWFLTPRDVASLVELRLIHNNSATPSPVWMISKNI